MADISADQALAALSGLTASPSSVSPQEALAQAKGAAGYKPVLPVSLSPERERRRRRLDVIRQAAKEGDQKTLRDMFRPTKPTIEVGGGLFSRGRMVEAEDTLFAKLPLPARSAITGLAGFGAVIENSISRLTGRGSPADKNRRALESLRNYNRELNKNSILGETVGPIVGDVLDSLAFGTVAAPFGGGGAGTAAGTRALAASSVAFGIDGADRTYVQAKDAGLSEENAGAAAARQFIIDGAVTFGAGKIIQNMGLNPGRYFGNTSGRIGQQAAEASGLRQVISSAVADASVEALQGQLSYINGAYTGLHDFDYTDMFKEAGLSAVAGGLAGGATSTVELASQRFQALVPQAVEGALDANEFHKSATEEEVQTALAAETPADFEAATGRKKGAVHRQAFQEELDSLVELEAVLDATGIELSRSLDAESQSIASQRRAIAEEEAAVQELRRELREIQQSQAAESQRPALTEKLAELSERESRIKKDKDDLEAAQELFDEREAATEGEMADRRAWLEQELDRLQTLEQEGTETDTDADTGSDIAVETVNPDRPTPKAFLDRYEKIQDTINQVGRYANAVDAGNLPDKAARKEISRLIDQNVSGEAHRASMFVALGDARTPGQFRKVLSRLGKQLHKAERRAAKADYDDALKRAKVLRPEFQEAVDEAVAGVNTKSADSLRDAADAIRTAAFESQIDQEMRAIRKGENREQLAQQAVKEIRQAKPLRMKADDPIRRAMSDAEGLKITRDYITADSPLLRELGSRPEVQLARLGPTAHDIIWEGLGVQGQAVFDNNKKEYTTQFSDVLDQVGLGHEGTPNATFKQIFTKKGTALEKWRNTQREIDGVRMTRDEAGEIVWLMRDPRNRDVLRKAGYEFDDGRVLPSVDNRIANQLRDFMGAEGQTVIEWAFKYGNGPLIDRVNDAWLQDKGHELTTHKDVVPRVVMEDMNVVGEDPLGVMREATLTSYRHTRFREGTNKPLKQRENSSGFIDTINRHFDNMTRIAAFLNRGRDAQNFINHPDVQKAILSRDGKEGLENIQEAIRVQAVGPKKPSGFGRTVGFLNGANAAATLALRFSTHVLQSLSTVVSSAWRPKQLRTFVQALPTLFSDAAVAEAEAVLGEHSGHHWVRYNSNDFSGEQTSGVYKGRGAFRPLTLSQQALRILQGVERRVNAVLRFHQSKEFVAREGVTPESPDWGPEVAREWERMTYRGENTSHGMELSGILREGRDNPFLGTAVQFMNTASKVYSLLPRAGDLMDQGQYKDAIGVLGVFVAAQLPVTLLHEAMSFRERDDDESFLDAVGERAVTDAAGLHPFGGTALVPLFRAMQGRRNWNTGSALVNNVTDLMIAVGSMARGYMDEGDRAENPQKYAEDLMKAASALATLKGLPFKGPEDLLKRAKEGTLFPGLSQADDYFNYEWTAAILSAAEMDSHHTGDPVLEEDEFDEMFEQLGGGDSFEQILKKLQGVE